MSQFIYISQVGEDPECAESFCLQLGGTKTWLARTIEKNLKCFCITFRAFVSITGFRVKFLQWARQKKKVGNFDTQFTGPQTKDTKRCSQHLSPPRPRGHLASLSAVPSIGRFRACLKRTRDFFMEYIKPSREWQQSSQVGRQIRILKFQKIKRVLGSACPHTLQL